MKKDKYTFQYEYADEIGRETNHKITFNATTIDEICSKLRDFLKFTLSVRILFSCCSITSDTFNLAPSQGEKLQYQAMKNKSIGVHIKLYDRIVGLNHLSYHYITWLRQKLLNHQSCWQIAY